MPTKKPEINVHTDGSCRPNPGKGGWAYIINYPVGQRVYASGGQKQATNNQMELQAAIEALRKVKNEVIQINIYTDSTYLQKGVTWWIAKWKNLGWKKVDGGEISNLEMWQEIDQLTAKKNIKWHWIKGHADNEFNNMADQLAQAAMAKIE